LKQFMGVKTATDRDLFWYVVIHLVFVGSSVLLALSDRISAGDHSTRTAAHDGPDEAPAAMVRRPQH
jgi:uncharacterized membrane protein YqhA